MFSSELFFLQNDEVFTFKFNVMVSDGGGRWTSRSVSAICSGLSWTHREIMCEEDYMEVRTPFLTCWNQSSELVLDLVL